LGACVAEYLLGGWLLRGSLGLGACLVGMDYTRYSALQSSTVSYAVTYLGIGWELWLGWLGYIYIQSTNPSTLLFQLHLSLRGYTVNQRHILRLVARCGDIRLDPCLALTVTPAGSLSCGHWSRLVTAFGCTLGTGPLVPGTST